MRHYLLVGNPEDVVGVWETPDARHAERLRLRLSLTFPGTPIRTGDAVSYEAFRATQPAFDLSEVQPESDLVVA